MKSVASLNFLANEEYYLPIRFYKNTKEFFQITEENNIGNWKALRDRIFIQYNPKNYNLPEHGWKIHVSATRHNNKEILSIVSNYCFNNEISFKFLLDQNIFEILNSKNGNRSSSGKFITIYPENENDFINHIENINQLLKGYLGPYILTDRRYDDNKVLYYRYGQILPKKDETFILGPNKEIFNDNRNPIYQKPKWIVDPIVENNKSEEKNKSYLIERYKIEKAIRFTNAGGTYLALDRSSRKKVIIKEARPYTAEFGESMNSVTMKENEYRILSYLKKHFHNNEFPEPIEIFKDWEHTFLVESYVQGNTVEEFTLKNSYFTSPNQNFENFKGYLKDIFIICTNINNLLTELHSHQIYVNDISPGNIILDGELNPTFIDLDSSIDLNDDGEKILVGTTGFHDTEDNVLSYKRDYKGIGYLAFYMLSPTINLSTIDDKFINRHLNFLKEKYHIPSEYCNFIEQLILDGSTSKISKEHMVHQINIMEKPRSTIDVSDLKLSDKIMGIYKFIDKSKIKDFEVMYPSNPFAQNYIGLSSGTAGVLLALKKISNLDKSILKTESETTEFLLSQYKLYNKANQLDFGLLDGKSGIIWSLLDVDKTSDIVKGMTSSLLEDINVAIHKKDMDFSIDKGLAGKGLLLLKLYLIFNEKKYLDLCEVMCEKIIERFLEDNLEVQEIGLNKGNTGISLLFYYMYKLTGRIKYYDYGYKILSQDLYEYKEISGGWLYPDRKRDNNTIYYPYLSSGTAGITAVYLRYYKENIGKFDKNILEKLIRGMQAEFSVDLGLYSGLTGLIHVHYDISLYLEDENMKNRTNSLLENLISILKDSKDNTLQTPGQLMYKYGCDYSNGGAGIIELINRIRKKEYNYYLFLDGYFIN